MVTTQNELRIRAKALFTTYNLKQDCEELTKENADITTVLQTALIRQQVLAEHKLIKRKNRALIRCLNSLINLSKNNN